MSESPEKKFRLIEKDSNASTSTPTTPTTSSNVAGRFLTREFPIQSPLLSRLKKFSEQINEEQKNPKPAEDCGIKIVPIPVKQTWPADREVEVWSDPDDAEGDVEFDIHLVPNEASESESSSDEEDQKQKPKKTPTERRSLIQVIEEDKPEPGNSTDDNSKPI